MFFDMLDKAQDMDHELRSIQHAIPIVDTCGMHQCMENLKNEKNKRQIVPRNCYYKVSSINSEDQDDKENILSKARIILKQFKRNDSFTYNLAFSGPVLESVNAQIENYGNQAFMFK